MVPKSGKYFSILDLHQTRRIKEDCVKEYKVKSSVVDGLGNFSVLACFKGLEWVMG